MRRALSWLALPFVALAMVVVPLFGGHFCPQEAIPLLGGAAALPLIGPGARRLVGLLRRRKPHCCDTGHSQYTVRPVVKNGHVKLEAQPRIIRDLHDDECIDFCGTDFPHKNSDHSK